MLLDVAPFAPEVGRVLLLRGSGVQPILWKTNPNRGAKKIIDEADDATLFGLPKLADERMGTAVRALLYLWTGWPAECRMCAQGAPGPEAMYLSALAELHQGQTSQAKLEFKALQSHPVFEPLARFARTVTESVPEPAIQRLQDMLKMDSKWEPYLFSDAVALAAAGRLKPAGEAAVREIQRREYELLLIHCYPLATGHPLAQRPRTEPSQAERRNAERERRMREDRRRRDERRQHEDATGRPATPGTPAGSTVSLPPLPMPGDDLILVCCPKCANTGLVPSSLRGKATVCQKCAAQFLVPSSKGTAAPESRPAPISRSAPAPRPAASPSMVNVLCPKCGSGSALPAASRGQRTACKRCGTTFVVPQGQPAGTR